MRVFLNKRDLRRFVEEQILEGRFATPTEVIEAGLAKLMLDSKTDELDARDLADIATAEKQIADGQDLDWKDVSAALRAKYLSE